MHHTSFLWDFNPDNMSYLKIPEKQPAYRENRKHTDFLTTLSNHFTSLDVLESKLEHELKNRFDVMKVNMKDVIPLLTQEGYRKSNKYIDL